MKAYEFYVLLGKYKRKSITPTEYERFLHALETVRSFRYAFYESTGEYVPHYRKKIKRNPASTPDSRIPDQSASEAPDIHKDSSIAEKSPENENAEHSWSSVSSEIYGRSQRSKSDDAVTAVIEHHSEFRRVRNSRRNRKKGGYRLLMDVARHNPFAVFLVGVLMTALIIVMIIKPGFSHHSVKMKRHSKMEPLAPETIEQEGLDASLTSGKFMSEADRLLSVDLKSFELPMDITEPMKAPITGLEQSIHDGLEVMFPDPAEALSEIAAPIIETTESNNKTPVEAAAPSN